MSIPTKQRERQPHTHSVGRKTLYRGIVYRYMEKENLDSQKKNIKNFSHFGQKSGKSPCQNIKK